jgi:hypothetical protein
MVDGFHTEQVGQITLHIFTNSSDAAVEAWGAALREVIETTPPDRVFRVLLDVSAKQVNFTRHARQVSVAIFTHYRQRRGKVALLFSSKVAPHFARIFFASLGKMTIELGYFSQREPALEWLQR